MRLAAANRTELLQGVVDRAPTPAGGRGVARVLRAVFADAERLERITTNRAKYVRPPKAQRPKLNILTTAQVDLILAAAGEWGPLIGFSAVTATRRGEALGLPWQNVDLNKGVVRITRTLQSIDRRLQFMSPKTERSRREIQLPPAAVALLRRQHAAQAERRLRAGNAWVEGDLVWDRGNGEPVSPDLYSHTFAKIAAQVGLAGTRLHDLRHYVPSELLRRGVNVKVISEMLGHHSVAFTLDVYAHLLPNAQEASSRALEDALGAALCRPSEK
jgi:integrase